MTINIEKCTQCQFHRIIPDPDPFDWFCDDDCAVRCTKSEKSPTRTENHSLVMVEPMVTVACRPYNVEKESTIPDWCPLKIS